VQVYVSNLRKALGDGQLVTRGHGYVLQAEACQVDSDCFEALAAEGRAALQAGDGRGAGALLSGALMLWRGPPLADFAYERFAQAEIARLEEARLEALEDRIDADLAIGELAGLVGELEALVGEHPLRERLQGQLMLALYRSGRQADALERYRDARRSLAEQLGLEPGRRLQELERAILAQDPALDPPRGAPRPLPGMVAQRTRRGAWLIVAAGAVLLAALVVAVIRLSSGGGGSLQVAANSVAVIEPRTNSVVSSAAVGTRPGPIVFGSGSLWVANLDDQTVSRIDPGSLRTLRVLPLRNPPTGLAAGVGVIWVAQSNPQASSVSVNAIDPQFNALGATTRVANPAAGGPGAVAAQGNTVWVAPSSGLLTRLDSTGRVLHRVDPNSGPAAIALGAGATWLVDTEGDNVIRVDPTGVLTPIAVGNGPTAIAVGEGGVWVADSLDDSVVRIDPARLSVTDTISVGRSPAGVAVGAGSVWVANSGDGTVTRIDPRTRKVQAMIAVGGSPQAITVADRRAWVTVDAQTIRPTGLASGGGTLRIESEQDVDSMDPALAYAGLSWQLLYTTCAKLLNYPDTPGPAGMRLIPEVAKALPARSPDGKTYTFTIRPGFRFSPPSNQPVTAQTFKYTIERSLDPRMRGPYAHYYADIVGARAYMAGKANHIAGVSADGNMLTVHLLAPAPNFLSRIALPALCAVPANTPVNPNGEREIPSAGPYYVASYTPGQGVVLARNPNYHRSRPHHFERVQIAVGISADRAVADIEAGRADYTTLGSTARSLATLAARLAGRYGPASPAASRGHQQYFINPGLQLDYFVLNTHRPLFSDAQLRQAVNYAIDRRELAALGDGYQQLPERPTDHYLPPGMAGFRDAHIYPLTPNLAKARQLVHGNQRPAVLYTCDVALCLEQAQIVKTDLAAIGLQVQINTFPSATLFAKEATPGEPFDLAWYGWAADYPDPQGMLDPILADSGNQPTFENPTYRHKLAAAAKLSGPERYLAYGILDIDLARNAAPLAAFGNLSSHDFFSARIGCQTYNPYWGMDIAAFCSNP
jgi:YVTN family beta-propeller protein